MSKMGSKKDHVSPEMKSFWDSYPWNLQPSSRHHPLHGHPKNAPFDFGKLADDLPSGND